MKKVLFTLGAALFMNAAVFAQSTADSIASKYKLLPMPEANTTEKTFPVLGAYQLSGAGDTASGNLNITLDPENKGVVWIEGLPQGRVKAYLRKSPATYRILAQKTESGTQIPEGTLYFDPTANKVNVVLGKEYDEADPTSVFALNNAEAGLNATAEGEVKVKTDDSKVKAESKGDGTVKVKTKTPNAKSKSKVIYYTGTKIVQEGTSAPQQQSQPQQQQ